MFVSIGGINPNAVAPLAGAWIEICEVAEWTTITASLPSRERGLKLQMN